MLALILAILGAIYGWITATRRGGNTADKLQYAVGFGIAFGLAGFMAGLFLVQAGLV